MSLVKELRAASKLFKPEAHAAADRIEQLEKQLDDLLAALELMLERISEPPEANCSCHLSPPCADCVDFGGEREAFDEARAAIARVKEAA